MLGQPCKSWFVRHPSTGLVFSVYTTHYSVSPLKLYNFFLNILMFYTYNALLKKILVWSLSSRLVDVGSFTYSWHYFCWYKMVHSLGSVLQSYTDIFKGDISLVISVCAQFDMKNGWKRNKTITKYVLYFSLIHITCIKTKGIL